MSFAIYNRTTGKLLDQSDLDPEFSVKYPTLPVYAFFCRLREAVRSLEKYRQEHPDADLEIREWDGKVYPPGCPTYLPLTPESVQYENLCNLKRRRMNGIH